MRGHYELTFIVSGNYTDKEVEPIKKQVNAVLTEHGAAISKEYSLDKQKLAYQIKKNSHGYYLVVDFDADAEKLSAIERQLVITPGVLRHLIATRKIKTAEQITKEEVLRAKIKQQRQKEEVIALPVKLVRGVDSIDRELAPVGGESIAIADDAAVPAVPAQSFDDKLDKLLEGNDLV